ncbi:hypothetical protein DYB36_013207 [Aphanomyces astaci]|uniref:Uncharacterized protein n=2 Tax=Aphanomyces astaci TaxID=112090 RepID=A0A397AT43_APHAT|nr:hypothetical protein DYB36_013207 [Aphanomyces astaci]
MAAVASAASFRVASAPVDRHLTAEQQYRAEKYVGLLYRGAAQEQGPTRRLKEEGENDFVAAGAAPEEENSHLAAQQDKESEVRGATRPQRRLSFHDAAAPVDRHLAAEQRFQELKHVGILSRGAAHEQGTHSLTDFLFVPVLPSAHIQNEEGDIRAGQKPTGGFFELPDERRLTGQQQHSGQELWGVELDSVGDSLIVPVLPTSIGAGGEANAFHPRAVAKAKALGGARSIGIQQVGHMSPSD